MHLRFPFCLGLLLALAITDPARGGSAPAPPAKVGASANKGKTGTYQCKTSRDGYNYYVCVPACYSEGNPAGLHLFFHGQGGQGGAPHFGHWSKYFLDPYNLIGINMQYMDGDNAKDTPGKVAAAQEAVAQTIADYRILPGRGVISSFSGGGLPHGLFTMTCANRNRGAARPAWPFNHAATYGSNFTVSAAGAVPMSWYIGVGSEEWGMGLPILGENGIKRTNELLNDIARGGLPDFYFKIIKGKGHSISDEDVAASAQLFERSDLAFSPVFYEADFPEKELSPIVRQANQLQLGAASKAIDKALAGTLGDEAKKKAALVKERIDKRVEAALRVSKRLAEEDPVLIAHYGPVYLGQLRGHGRERELQDLLAEARKRKEYSSAFQAQAVLIREFSQFFGGKSPKLNPEKVPVVESLKTSAGEKSEIGVMCAEFLLLK